VGAPSFLAGNSIGGFTALSAAANLGAAACPGLILCNSAGRMIPQAEYAAERAARGGATLKEAMLAEGLPEKAPPPPPLPPVLSGHVSSLLPY